jgi:dTDP-4-dehydrorhamnose reductase
MKLLVIGSAGQLARSLAEKTGPAVEVVVAGRPEVDLKQPASVRRAIEQHEPFVVVNAAAYTAVDKAESEPHEAFKVNARGAGGIARCCEAAGIALIHISTDYVFDGSSARAYVETDATHPLGVYGRSKLAGEEEVAAGTVQHVILRTSWVFSPFGSNFVKTMLRLAETRDEIAVVDDQIGGPTYAPDLADVVLAIATRLPNATNGSEMFGVFHAAGQGETTWWGLAREIFRLQAAAGRKAPQVKPIPTSAYPTPARRPANSQLDCSRLDRVFGLRLPPWSDGVARCLERLHRGG